MKKTLKTTGHSMFDQHDIKKRFYTPRFSKRSISLIVSFALIGTLLLIISFASTSTSTIEPEDSNQKTSSISSITDPSASGGGAIRFGTANPGNVGVRRFFADDASWNRPASDFGESTTLTPYVDRFWNYAGLPSTQLGGTNVDFRDYSVPIYDIAEANKNVRVFQAMWAQNQQVFSTSDLAIGSTIRWNDNWIPGTGNDRIMHYINQDTGENFGFWVVGEPKEACDDHSIFPPFIQDGPNTRAGYQIGNPDHLCMAAANHTNGLYTIKDGTTHTERGMGIDKLALVTRAKEVRSGAIRHALELTITSTMFGEPVCANNSSTIAGAGTDCGFYLKPATRVEFATNENNRIGTRCGTNAGGGYEISVNSASRAKTIPEGMRLALKITDPEIETWLNSRNYSGEKRNTARKFAVAFRDYGAIIAETGCFGIGIETDGMQNPTTKADWEAAGIIDDGSNNPSGDLLKGLITRERLYAVNPPN